MTTLEQTARRAESSKTADWGARAGIYARGLLWFVVGLLAANVATGGSSQADKDGALSALRDQPFGKAILVVVAIAFAAHAGFRLLEGTVGRRDEDDDRKRMLKRAWSLVRVVIYGFLAVSTARFLMSGGGGGENATKPTAKVMELPAGQWIVGVVALAIIITGIVLAVKGVKQDFTDKLNLPGGTMRTVVERTGTAGLVGRGLVYALVGSFLLRAAITFDPNKAKGLDESLKALAGQPFGEALLWLAVAALLSFAVWSFFEARYRKL